MSENISPESQADKLPATESTKTFAYSDGDEAENYLLKVISEAKDISLGSKELAAAIYDWPSEYHLSPIRGNLLRGFQFPTGASVLEIGAGCGAITRLLGEAGLLVTSVEGSPRRARIAAQRCRDLENVEVSTSNITDFKTAKKFDFVFLIGVLEYAPSFVKGEDPIGELLRICRSFLKKDGVLVVAIENRLGLKYLNGAPEDHIGRPFWGIQDLYVDKSPITFGREELCSRLTKAGLAKIDCYYPFPDYKLPEIIVSQRGLTNSEFCPGELLHQNYSGGNGQTYLASFDEPLAWSVIGKNGLIADLTNSFLLFASSKKQVAEPWLAKTFSSRGTITSFFETEDGIRVKKSGALELPPGPFQIKSEVAPYVTGRQYHNDLRRILMRGEGVEQIANLLRPWFNFLCGSTTSEVKIVDRLLPHDFIDCTPYNIVVSASGALEYIDREWVGENEPPLTWIFIRGVLHSIWRCGWKGALVNYTYRQAITEIAAVLGLPLSDSHFNQADELELHLIKSASGIEATKQSILDLKIENTVQLWRENFSGQLQLLSQAKLEIDSRDARLLELQRVVEERDQIRNERELIQAERDSLLTERSSLLTERDSLLLQKDTLTQTVHSQAETIESERAHQIKTTTEFESRIQNLETRLNSANQQLTEILSSKSWKVTAPLRKLRRKHLLLGRLQDKTSE